MQVVMEKAEGWRILVGKDVYAIHLSDEDVRRVADASAPTAFLASQLDGLCPGLGIMIAGAAVISAYALKRVNAKHGERGVVIRINVNSPLFLLAGPKVILLPAAVRIMGPST